MLTLKKIIAQIKRAVKVGGVALSTLSLCVCVCVCVCVCALLSVYYCLILLSIYPKVSTVYKVPILLIPFKDSCI